MHSPAKHYTGTFKIFNISAYDDTSVYKILKKATITGANRLFLSNITWYSVVFCLQRDWGTEFSLTDWIALFCKENITCAKYHIVSSYGFGKPSPVWVWMLGNQVHFCAFLWPTTSQLNLSSDISTSQSFHLQLTNAVLAYQKFGKLFVILWWFQVESPYPLLYNSYSANVWCYRLHNHFLSYTPVPTMSVA